MNERITLSVAVFDRILGVISQRPYAEIAALIAAIQKDARPLSDKTSVLSDLN